MAKSEKKTYSEKLKDPRWQKMRLEILSRDNWACKSCSSTTETLHVHHKYYVAGKEPWEYPIEALICLCWECHEMEESSKKENESLFLQTAYALIDDSSDLLGLASLLNSLKPIREFIPSKKIPDVLCFHIVSRFPVDETVINEYNSWVKHTEEWFSNQVSKDLEEEKLNGANKNNKTRLLQK